MDDSSKSVADNQPSTSGKYADNQSSEDPGGSNRQSKDLQDEDVRSIHSASPCLDRQSFDDIPWRDPASPIKPTGLGNVRKPKSRTSLEKLEPKEEEKSEKPLVSSGGAISIPPQLKYVEMKSALDKTVNSLPEVAAKTLFRYLDIHKPRLTEEKKRAKFTPEFIDTVSNQAKELEKQIKTTSRRITESKREQAHLAEQIENLKNKFIKDQEVTLISELVDKVPSSRDLERIQRLNEISLEWKQQQRSIDKVQIKIDALNKVMANLDVIIQESGAANKKRRVVFSSDLEGKCDAQTSPPPPAWHGFKEGFFKSDQIFVLSDESSGNEPTKDDPPAADGKKKDSEEDEDDLFSKKSGIP